LFYDLPSFSPVYIGGNLEFGWRQKIRKVLAGMKRMFTRENPTHHCRNQSLYTKPDTFYSDFVMTVIAYQMKNIRSNSK